VKAFLRPLKHGARRLLRTPFPAAAAVLSLALGIGANTAIFSVYKALILRSLPVHNPEELIFVRSHHPLFGEGRNISYPLYRDLSRYSRSFSGIAARSTRPLEVNVNPGSGAQRFSAELVSGNYYDVLGVSPELGRLLNQNDDSTPVVVLLYGCWQKRFGGDSDIIGKKLFIKGKPFTIIGVGSRNFRGTEVGSEVDVQIPVTEAGEILGGPDRLKQPRSFWLEAFGRLRPGISIEAAREETQNAYAAFRDPSIPGPDRLLLINGARGVSPVRSVFSIQLVVLMAVAGCMLLITCLNVANFLFARVFGRRQETALLAALGAGRAGLSQQPIAESILLSSAGAIIGLAVVVPLSFMLLRFVPTSILTGTPGSLVDWPVFFFSAVATALSSIIVAIYPAIWSARVAPAGLMGENGTVVGGRSKTTFSQVVLGLQIAVSAVLVLGAAVFLGTLLRLESRPTGFAATNLMFGSIDPVGNGYDLRRSEAFYGEFLDRVRKLPGITHAALSRLMPLSGDVDSNTVCADGYHPSQGERMEQNINTVTPDYFSAVGISLLSGRDFNGGDAAFNPRVAIINQRMAQDLFGSSNPLGRRIGIGCDQPAQANIEVVGVVTNARYDGPREEPARIAYIPYLQNGENFRMTLNISAALPTGELVASLRHELESLDSNIPLFDVHTMSDQFDRSVWRERMLAGLSGIFTILALALSGLGIYSVLSYTVQQRTGEIGLRLSLGASKQGMVFLVLRNALAWTAAGLMLGIPAAIAAIRFTSSLLFGIKPTEPSIIIATAGTIALCACLAAVAPVMRILNLDPARVLRCR
jgi:predicted permease